MMCPNCRAWADPSGDPSKDRYCRMCGADTAAVNEAAPSDVVANEAAPDKPKPNLSQLESYWEGDVAHWLRNGATPDDLRAIVETAIRKAQER